MSSSRLIPRQATPDTLHRERKAPNSYREASKKVATDDKLPYPDLFDKSERTFAATYAKFGDLTYFTPVQRIGAYMDYT